MAQKAIHENNRRCPVKLSIYRTDGTFVRYYDSIYAMKKDLNIKGTTISDVLNGKQKTYKGCFIIKSCDYEKEIIQNKIMELNKPKAQKNFQFAQTNEAKPVLMCSMVDGNVIKQFKSIKEAARFIEVKHTRGIRDAIDCQTRSAYGYRWKSVSEGPDLTSE